MQPHSAASTQLAQSCAILQLLPKRRAPVWLAATAAGVMGGRSAESRGIPSSSLVMVQVASGLELLLLLLLPKPLLLLLADGQMSVPTASAGRARSTSSTGGVRKGWEQHADGQRPLAQQTILRHNSTRPATPVASSLPLAPHLARCVASEHP